VFVNPTGRFVSDGAEERRRLTGRKIIVDTYGGMARHDDGAFSGKGPNQSTAWRLARRATWPRTGSSRVRRNVGLNKDRGVADRRPCARSFRSASGGDHPQRHLHRRIFKQSSSYGHFGRPDLDPSWEKTDRAEAERSVAGLKGSVDRELAPLTA